LTWINTIALFRNDYQTSSDWHFWIMIRSR